MDQLSPGVVKTVRWLNLHGFQTCDSGDGQTHEFGCDRGVPYVVIPVTPDRLVVEARRLVTELEIAGIRAEPINEEGIGIQATFDPANGSAFIDLVGVCDEDLVRVGAVE